MNDKHFKFSTSVLALPLFFVLSLWLVFWAERRFHVDLLEYGIYPRTVEGLKGIVLSPFLHGDTAARKDFQQFAGFFSLV